MNKETKPKVASTFQKFSQQVPDPTVAKVYEVRGESFVRYGIDNLYPNNLVTPLYNASAINRSCIVSKHIAAIGEGLRTKNPDLEYVLKRANPLEGWNDIFSRAMLDYIIYGGFGLNIIFDRLGEKIVDMYNMDFNDIRSGHIDYETDRVEWYYYSADWTKIKRDIYKPKAYKSFDPSRAGEYPNQILYFFNHNPGQKYYPLPDYSGSLTDAQVDVQVSNFHYWNLMNGCNPSMLIQFHDGMPSPEERQDIYQEIASNFSGTDNTGRFFLAFAPNKEHNMEVTPIDGANSDYMVEVESRITSRILTGHRITSPLLLGIKDLGSSGLTNNKDEIIVAYQHFVSTVIQPYQATLLKVFDRLLNYYGYDTELYIEPKRLFNEEGVAIGQASTDAIV